MKFIVDKSFFEKVDNACFGVIIARNIDNTKPNSAIQEMLKNEVNEVAEKYKDVKVKELPEIVLYREAFKKVDINPNKFMCSIEALVSRTVKSQFVPNINTLVDLGNALSLKYNVPLGVHDIDKFAGDIELRFAVKTRKWAWRQGEKSKIDENIKNAFIPLDGFIENKEKIIELQKEFVKILTDMGATCEVGFVDKDNNVFEF